MMGRVCPGVLSWKAPWTRPVNGLASQRVYIREAARTQLVKHKFDFSLYCSHSKVVVVAITRVQKSPCQMSFAAAAEVQLDGIGNSVKESTENDELLDGENRVPSFVTACFF